MKFTSSASPQTTRKDFFCSMMIIFTFIVAENPHYMMSSEYDSGFYSLESTVALDRVLGVERRQNKSILLREAPYLSVVEAYQLGLEINVTLPLHKKGYMNANKFDY